MKVREVIRLIEADGWYQVKMVGSHRQYKHAEKLGRVTVAGHPNDDVHPKTLTSIFRQAQIRRR
ncbi:MAG TPA: type II toxin-antitoxin system HicA family toxin [Ktedonobacteraceae bacterium]|nr:type II toxin-antitoxin system HicA family toxin [Ktedonobacteraceae bacterium]